MGELTKSSLPSGALSAVHEASLTITSELSLPVVLERIVNIARDLSGAKYAALGVPSPDGGMAQFVVSGLSDEQVAAIDHFPRGEGLLGMLLRPGAKTLRLRNISGHSDSSGFPQNHPIMTSFLGVPIAARGELLGSLYLTDKQDDEEFTEEDERLIELLAAHAAIAIENANLYQRVRRLAVLEERERIGMDLHDGIIQSIYAVGLTLEYATLHIDDNLEEARGKMQEAVGGLNAIIRDIRNYILDLRPQKFRGGDLESGLHKLLREFRANTLAEFDFAFSPDLGTLEEETANLLFHIAQEALANASKHAAATRVSISVYPEGDQMVLRVRDNGRGFPVEEVEAVAGHGLSNMEARANAAGGRLRIESSAGQGTTVWAHVRAHSVKRE